MRPCIDTLTVRSLLIANMTKRTVFILNTLQFTFIFFLCWFAVIYFFNNGPLTISALLLPPAMPMICGTRFWVVGDLGSAILCTTSMVALIVFVCVSLVNPKSAIWQILSHVAILCYWFVSFVLIGAVA